LERRLAAILAADVVGYTALMGADEAGTLERLTGLRQDFLEPLIADHHGRVVKLMGDGILVEFASVVDAVACALAWQVGVAERDEAFKFRIGINLGDVIVEGEDIHGDGVNVASRLEGLAEPGGVCLSDDAYRQVRGKTQANFEDLGEQSLKNVAEPVRVYRITSDITSTTVPVMVSEPMALPDTPSIAVLPFTNMSGDPEQEFFSDGITEDIITALSKISSLLVVARNSTFTYKGHTIDLKRVSHEQGVRYVLEGSVRKVGKRVRVTAQLIDATTGHHMWAERYDRDLEDIFAVQDEITREVVIALDVRLSKGEQARFWSGGTTNLKAWECVRLGAELFNQIDLESNLEGARLFKMAIDLDPDYAIAWVMLGWTYFHQADVGSLYRSEEQREAMLNSTVECAQKALELDPSCADAYAELGLCHLSKGEHDQAIAMSEKAVALAPNHSEILATSAVTQIKSGHPKRAFELIRKAMRLCPVYPSWYLWALGTACRLTGQTGSAILAFEEGIKRSPDHLALHAGLASTLAELGRERDAQTSVSEILRLDPDFSIKNYLKGLSYRDPAELARFEDGLRKAGLPG
jgi:adenylate cyclase